MNIVNIYMKRHTPLIALFMLITCTSLLAQESNAHPSHHHIDTIIEQYRRSPITTPETRPALITSLGYLDQQKPIPLALHDQLDANSLIVVHELSKLARPRKIVAGTATPHSAESPYRYAQQQLQTLQL